MGWKGAGGTGDADWGSRLRGGTEIDWKVHSRTEGAAVGCTIVEFVEDQAEDRNKPVPFCLDHLQDAEIKTSESAGASLARRENVPLFAEI
ncbi:hypothetical protein BSZ35_07460 [Salinibacter sp. 10B]|nr:hypothetical protein BSZ35_07460 [Salinibacter sp. 10B]